MAAVRPHGFDVDVAASAELGCKCIDEALRPSCVFIPTPLLAIMYTAGVREKDLGSSIISEASRL